MGGGRVGAQAPDQLAPVHYRHHHVRHHQLWRRLAHGLQGLRPMTRIGHLMPGLLEDPPKYEAQVWLVINDQDPGHEMPPLPRQSTPPPSRSARPSAFTPAIAPGAPSVTATE